MRRNDFTLDVGGVDWVEDGGEPEKPTVLIDFKGDADGLHDRLSGPDGGLLSADETDVAFRLLSDADAEDAEGVVSVTNRVTGDYVLELNADADDVFTFIRAARRYGEDAGDDGQYRVEVGVNGDPVATYDKTTFLVYNQEGDLLRRHSLIPGGVEL
jgi:hypothetical protein